MKNNIKLKRVAEEGRKCRKHNKAGERRVGAMMADGMG